MFRVCKSEKAKSQLTPLSAQVIYPQQDLALLEKNHLILISRVPDRFIRNTKDLISYVPGMELAETPFLIGRIRNTLFIVTVIISTRCTNFYHILSHFL